MNVLEEELAHGLEVMEEGKGRVTDHLLFVLSNILMMKPFDEMRLEKDCYSAPWGMICWTPFKKQIVNQVELEPNLGKFERC